MTHIHLTILISACWSAIFLFFPYRPGLTSMQQCNILLRTQLLYSLPVIINDISIFASNGTNCLNLFHPIRTLVSTTASGCRYSLLILESSHGGSKSSLVRSPQTSVYDNRRTLRLKSISYWCRQQGNTRPWHLVQACFTRRKQCQQWIPPFTQ